MRIGWCTNDPTQHAILALLAHQHLLTMYLPSSQSGKFSASEEFPLVDWINGHPDLALRTRIAAQEVLIYEVSNKSDLQAFEPIRNEFPGLLWFNLPAEIGLEFMDQLDSMSMVYFALGRHGLNQSPPRKHFRFAPFDLDQLLIETRYETQRMTVLNRLQAGIQSIGTEDKNQAVAAALDDFLIGLPPVRNDSTTLS
jgi:hypothetical protein